MLIEPRPYQLACIDASATAERDGVQRQLVVMSTGTGKTATGEMIAKSRGKRTLWISHRDELVTQPLATLAQVWPEVTYGIVKAERNEYMRQFVSASIQTITREKRLACLLQEQWDLVVVDEAHHALSEGYKNVLHALGCFREGGPLLIGLTATPERSDGGALEDVFQRIVFQLDISTAINLGYLVPPVVTSRPIKIDLDKVSKRGGDFSVRELDAALLSAGIVDEIVAAYTEHATNRKSIVFTVSVSQAEAVAAALRERGHAVAALSGETPTELRKQMLRQLKTGELRCLVNCMVLTEGFDEPSVDCVILARPTQSKPLMIQMVGRGLRLYPSKTDCMVIDLVGLSKRHTMVQAAVLFGKLVEEDEREPRAPLQGDMFVDPEEFWRKRLTSQAAGVKGAPRSKLRWIVGSGGAWLLDSGQYGTVRMVPVMTRNTEGAPSCTGSKTCICPLHSPSLYDEPSELWDVEAVNVRVGTQPRLSLSPGPVDLSAAQGIAEDYVRRVASASGLASSRAPWLQQQASEKQIAALKRFGVKDAERLTRGTASDLLTKFTADRATRPATPKQIASLRRRGFAVSDSLTQQEASRMFAKNRVN